MTTAARTVTYEQMTRSQRKAYNRITAQGVLEVKACEPLDEAHPRHLWVVVGAARECWVITPRGKCWRPGA